MIWDEIRRLSEYEIPQAEFALEKAYAQATRCTASLSGMPGAHDPGSIIERNWDLIEKREDELFDLRCRLDSLRAIATTAIAKMEQGKEKYVMIKRFLEGKPMAVVESELLLSKNYGFELLRKARAKVDVYLPECDPPTVS